METLREVVLAEIASRILQGEKTRASDNPCGSADGVEHKREHYVDR